MPGALVVFLGKLCNVSINSIMPINDKKTSHFTLFFKLKMFNLQP